MPVGEQPPRKFEENFSEISINCDDDDDNDESPDKKEIVK